MVYDYKSWIPANSGTLSIERISRVEDKKEGNSYIFIEEETFRFSDSFSKKNEIPISYKLKLESKDGKDEFPFSFELELFYEAIKNENKILLSKGDIEKNGFIEYSIYYSGNLSEDESDLENMPNTIYTIIKNIIHNDGHHDSAVDNVIPVEKIKNFSCENILDSISNKIKKMEYEAKSKSKRKIPKYIFDILESYEHAKGFYSYYLTFYQICKNKKNNFDLTKNVLTSFESIANLAKRRLDSIKYITSVFLTLLAIYISTNILIKGESFGVQTLFNKDIDLLKLEIGFFIILILSLIIIDFFTTQLLSRIFSKKKVEFLFAKLIYAYHNKNYKIIYSIYVFLVILIIIGTYLFKNGIYKIVQ